MDGKPKVGLLLVAAEWFWQQNIQGAGGRYKAVAEMVDADAEAIAGVLAPHLDLVRVGLVHTVEGARAAARTLRNADLDLLLVCSIIWSEDRPLLTALHEVGDVPLLVWCCVPEETLPAQVSTAELFRRSGPVGAVQHSGMLKRLGVRFGFVCGAPTESRVVREIVDHAAAARLARELRNVTVGLLPYRCDAMTGTYVDESRLMAELGPALRYVSVHEYASVAQSVSDRAVEGFVRELRERYAIHGVGEESLSCAARASLGLAALAEELGLDAIALNDLAPELHRVMRVRPFLGVAEFFEKGRVISMEADVAAAVGLLMAQRLGGAPPMYTEIFTFDKARNAVLAGHAGMHDLRLAESPAAIRVTPDYEYCESSELEGAWFEFRARPGRVTLASFFCDVGRFKIVIAEGESLSDGPRLEGFAHMLVRLDMPLAEFFRRIVETGVTQHWAITHADVKGRLVRLAAVLGLDCIVL